MRQWLRPTAKIESAAVSTDSTIPTPTMNPITEARRIFVVRYADKYSAEKSSQTDMRISIEHNIIGCGSRRFGTAVPGDLAILVANMPGRERDAIFCVGILGETIDYCPTWFKRGGYVWPYNYHFRALTPSIRRADIDEAIRDICSAVGVKYRTIFNPRFGSEKNIRPFLLEACERGVLTLG